MTFVPFTSLFILIFFQLLAKRQNYLPPSYAKCQLGAYY